MCNSNTVAPSFLLNVVFSAHVASVVIDTVDKVTGVDIQ
jgi:hypothetical protein